MIRAIFILSTFIALILSGCTSIEVAKEVTKAGDSIKTSFKKAVLQEEQKLPEEEKEGNISQEKITLENKEIIILEEQQKEKILFEKKEITKAKKQGKKVILKQNKIAKISFIGKTLTELTKELGEPKILREDGKTRTARFDTQNCRIFIYFNSALKKPQSEYYELRNSIGELVEEQKDIEKCFKEIKLV